MPHRRAGHAFSSSDPSSQSLSNPSISSPFPTLNPTAAIWIRCNAASTNELSCRSSRARRAPRGSTWWSTPSIDIDVSHFCTPATVKCSWGIGDDKLTKARVLRQPAMSSYYLFKINADIFQGPLQSAPPSLQR